MRRLAWCLIPLLGLQLAACGSKSTDAPVARTPDDLLGIWVPDAAPRELTANGAPPPLTEDAAAVYAKHKERFATGERVVFLHTGGSAALFGYDAVLAEGNRSPAAA